MLRPGGFDSMDSFVIAVLVGAGLVVLVLALMVVMDKGKPAAPASAPAKTSGKR